MSRFVLLHHEWPGHAGRPSHCDLMLEASGVLRAWALAELPHDWASMAVGAIVASNDNTVLAEALGDHRMAYLEYEGPVSGDRGTVRRLDRGECRLNTNAADVCAAELSGTIVRGVIELRRADANWRLTLR